MFSRMKRVNILCLNRWIVVNEMDRMNSAFNDFHNILFNPIEKYSGSVLEVGSGEGHLSNYIHTRIDQ